MPPKSVLAIGELSERTGLSVSAIRFYEEKGLITPHRNSGGHRRYMRSDIRRLSFVMIAQKFGFTLPEIREQLSSLPGGRTPTKEDWSRLSEGFRTHLDARIATLEKLRDDLDGCIGCGCLSLPSCALYNAGDSAAKNGQGPRFLMGDSPET